MKRIIFFDGECNLCNSSVQFVIKRDPKGIYQFASLQSDFGQQVILKHRLPKEIDSFIYLEGGTLHIKSTAALKVCKGLSGLWKVLYVFIIVPKPIRNLVYECIARNRYKWFGKRESCMIPTPDMRDRFIDN
ncbi:thiol-disulfide oxidoreductase DCC family protein [Ornithinibacillus scapharcae]|uniref:thiol-disulfide oxidoreductase DCC family protein n=1 Tax=Ornithinibacillus scapharcae TaxID=1147159 RepID=UPI000225C0CD|nr:thiol-disulfide oxidoreductase DCC family protein [Ornithinibacillus scapharcae]